MSIGLAHPWGAKGFPKGSVLSPPSLATMAQRIQDELAAFFLSTTPPRMVLVRNKKVGVVFRLINSWSWSTFVG